MHRKPLQQPNPVSRRRGHELEPHYAVGSHLRLARRSYHAETKRSKNGAARREAAMSDGTKRSRRPNSSAVNKVGYGMPPRTHQFQPGYSGNAKGRPKGSKNTAMLLREILDRKIEVRSGSTVRRISVREAMLTRFAESALRGDTKSAAFLLQRYDAMDSSNEQSDGAANRDEQEIIDAYLEAYSKRIEDRK